MEKSIKSEKYIEGLLITLKQEHKSMYMMLVPIMLIMILCLPTSVNAQGNRGRGFGMGPPVTEEIIAEVVAAKTPIAESPFEPTWDSIETNYKVPDWFRDAKFGIMMHWGLCAVPAKQSEWYVKHMYGNKEIMQWYIEKFGPLDKYGYKDFIPMFTCEKYDPGAWAELFKKAGAKYIIPTAEHHDGFSLWDSDLNKYCAKRMGPKRDLIGDLAKACRSQGLKFGVSNHSIEHFTFINPIEGVKTDLYDPQWSDFYAVADRSPEACREFLKMWVAKNIELIDKYQADILWFDNGVNHRIYDPLKLKVAAYYYNRARQWGSEVSISIKSDAYLHGSIKDFERQGRAPKEQTDYVWQVDDPVLYRFGYTENSPIASAESVIHKLVENVCRNGNLLLNISPKADGTIPDDQQELLLNIGKWLRINGEAIYGTRSWRKFGEGNLNLERGQRYTGKDFRFTTVGNTLYVIVMAWPGEQAVITSLAKDGSSVNKVESVSLLGHEGKLEFTQDEEGLKVRMPTGQPCEYAFAFEITGLKLR